LFFWGRKSCLVQVDVLSILIGI